jgi:hypothetical protein
MTSSYGLPTLRRPASGVEGTGLSWFSRPYPQLPYRDVMGMYPRDMSEVYALDPQQRAVYEQRAVTLLGNQVTKKQTQWLFPDSPPTQQTTPPLQYGSHYVFPYEHAALPRPPNVAFTASYPHRPEIYRVGSISPFNPYTGGSSGN